MSKIGKISSLKKEYNGSTQTVEKSLSAKGLTRMPGTGVFKYPYKEADGSYRTGLDENAAYIKRIKDPDAQSIERERVKKLRQKLQNELNLDLGPKSSFWNYALSLSANDTSHVQPEKLMDGDNYFDLSNPWRELTFSWLRVHPTIASSYMAWERGEYPADTQFYVVDDEVENEILFKKKESINKAIVLLTNMTPEKKRKVARLLELPVSDDTKDSIVYNMIDNVLKQTEFKSGKHQGLNPVNTFVQYATLEERILHVKDLIRQAITHSVYRIKAGRVFEGQAEIARTEEDLLKTLLDEDNQEELLMLESKLKDKKLANV